MCDFWCVCLAYWCVPVHRITQEIPTGNFILALSNPHQFMTSDSKNNNSLEAFGKGNNLSVQSFTDSSERVIQSSVSAPFFLENRDVVAHT